jgi:hypothetical protein
VEHFVAQYLLFDVAPEFRAEIGKAGRHAPVSTIAGKTALPHRCWAKAPTHLLRLATAVEKPGSFGAFIVQEDLA